MKGEVEEDEVDSDEENLYIPEDEEDDGPCAPLGPAPPPRLFSLGPRSHHLPWESTTGVKGVKDILLESEFGFQAKNVQDALEEMDLVGGAWQTQQAERGRGVKMRRSRSPRAAT